VNADDFGMSHAVNAGVLKAAREGVLSSASLMVTGDAAGEAARVARENPYLAVGLHVALGDARSALARELVPELVDERSRFPANPLVSALKYAFHGPSRRRLRVEIEEQFSRFADTGLPLSHVDGHQHLHAHPSVLPIVLELALRHGAKGIRVPREPVWLSLRLNRAAPGFKAGVALGTAFLGAVCSRHLRDCGLARCDYTIGSLMSGMMNSDFAVRALRELNCRSVEMFFHPTVGPVRVPFGPNPGDLDTLLSPDFKQILSTGEWKLTNYAGLAACIEEVCAEPA
jgi:hopanoid biosynthesis associated protein HpnK